MPKGGCLALSVQDAGTDGFRYVVLLSGQPLGEEQVFRASSIRASGYPTAHHAWFAGVNAVLAYERGRAKRRRRQPVQP